MMEKITFPPPKPKIVAIAKHESNKIKEKSPEEIAQDEINAEKKAGKLQFLLLAIGALVTWFIGYYAP